MCAVALAPGRDGSVITEACAPRRQRYRADAAERRQVARATRAARDPGDTLTRSYTINQQCAVASAIGRFLLTTTDYTVRPATRVPATSTTVATADRERDRVRDRRGVGQVLPMTGRVTRGT